MATKAIDKPLNDREQMFVANFTVNLKPYEAAIAAGYAETTAKTKAFMWASESKCPPGKRHVFNAIQQAKRQQLDQVEVDALYVLRRLHEQVEADLADIYYEDGSFKDIQDWPLVWRQGLVAGVETETKQIGKKMIITTTKVKLQERIKSLQLLGKHVDVQAFLERKEIEIVDGRAARLKAARARVLDLTKQADGTYAADDLEARQVG